MIMIAKDTDSTPTKLLSVQSNKYTNLEILE